MEKVKLTSKAEKVYLLRRAIILELEKNILSVRDIVDGIDERLAYSLVEYHTHWLEKEGYVRRYSSPFKNRKPVYYELNPDRPFDTNLEYELIAHLPVRLMSPEEKREYRRQVKERNQTKRILEGLPEKEDDTQVEVQIAPHIRMIYNSRRPPGFYSYQTNKPVAEDVGIGSTMALF